MRIKVKLVALVDHKVRVYYGRSYKYVCLPYEFYSYASAHLGKYLSCSSPDLSGMSFPTKL